MSKPVGNVMEMDVWVRNSDEATTLPLASVSSPPTAWTEADVRALLVEMLRALERANNPQGEPPSTVSLRGFSWIVSPSAGGVLVHVEMPMGTASAGPFAIDEKRLTDMINRVMYPPVSTAVH